MTEPLRSRTLRVLVPVTAGLTWPRRRRGEEPTAVERSRLLDYERLMGLAHVAAVSLALVAVLVHVDFTTADRAGDRILIVLGASLAFGLGYHLVLARWWCSHTKVLAGLCVDVLITTAVVQLSGHHMSLLVFLYYLVIAAGAITLDTRAVLSLCALISSCFLLMLPFDPTFTGAPGAHLGHVAVFLVSVWLVGWVCASAAARIQAGERRLMEATHEQHRVAAEKAALAALLAVRLGEGQHLLATLARERAQSRRLAELVLSAQEDERGRVARELHDETNQLMAALMTGVDIAERQGRRHQDAALMEALGRVRRIATAALTDLQRIAHELRPAALDEFGLLPALKRLADERARDGGLLIDVAVEARADRIPAALELTLYRIAQEALTNVVRHARAGRVHVRLRRHAGMVGLDVADDGVGFLPETAVHGMGVAGMRERAALGGGTLDIWSRPGGGSRVSAWLPVASAGVPLATR